MTSVTLHRNEILSPPPAASENDDCCTLSLRPSSPDDVRHVTRSVFVTPLDDDMKNRERGTVTKVASADGRIAGESDCCVSAHPISSLSLGGALEKPRRKTEGDYDDDVATESLSTSCRSEEDHGEDISQDETAGGVEHVEDEPEHDVAEGTNVEKRRSETPYPEGVSAVSSRPIVPRDVQVPPGNVGVIITSASSSSSNHLVISSVLPSSMVQNVVSAGDVVLAINGKTTAGMSARVLTKMLSTASDKPRKLTVMQHADCAEVEDEACRPAHTMAHTMAPQEDLIENDQQQGSAQEEDVEEGRIARPQSPENTDAGEGLHSIAVSKVERDEAEEVAPSPSTQRVAAEDETGIHQSDVQDPGEDHPSVESPTSRPLSNVTYLNSIEVASVPNSRGVSIDQVITPEVAKCAFKQHPPGQVSPPVPQIVVGKKQTKEQRLEQRKRQKEVIALMQYLAARRQPPVPEIVAPRNDADEEDVSTLYGGRFEGNRVYENVEEPTDVEMGEKQKNNPAGVDSSTGKTSVVSKEDVNDAAFFNARNALRRRHRRNSCIEWFFISVLVLSIVTLVVLLVVVFMQKDNNS